MFGLKLSKHTLDNMDHIVNYLYGDRRRLGYSYNELDREIVVFLIGQAIDRGNEDFPLAWFIFDPCLILQMINNMEGGYSLADNYTSIYTY